MRSIQYLTLDINKRTQQTITANVGDVGSRFVKIQIVDDGKPINLIGVDVYLYALKSDNTKLFNVVVVEDDIDGIVLAELTSQVLVQPGNVKLTLVLIEGNNKLSSKEFTLNVENSIFSDEVIESTNEFGALTTSLVKVEEWNGYFEETSGQIEEKYTTRLNKIDEQFNTKANENEVVKRGQVDLDDLNERTIQAIQGGEGANFSLLSIPRESSVGMQQISKELYSNEIITSYEFANYSSQFNHTSNSLVVSENKINKKGFIKITLKTAIEGDITIVLLKNKQGIFKIINTQTFNNVKIGVNELFTKFYIDDEDEEYFVGFYSTQTKQHVYGTYKESNGFYLINTDAININDEFEMSTVLRNSTFPIMIEMLNFNNVLDDNSITINKLDNKLIQENKCNSIDFSQTTKTMNSFIGRIIVQDSTLSGGIVKLKISSNSYKNISIYLLEKNDDKMIIKQTDIITLKKGENTILTNLKSVGNGKEYVGIKIESNTLNYINYDGKNGFKLSSDVVNNTSLNSEFIYNDYINSTLLIEIATIGLVNISQIELPEYKNVVLFGDSLTNGDLGTLNGVDMGNTNRPWHKTYAEITGNKVVSKAKNGATIKAQLDIAQTLNYDDVDIVNIMLGTNGGVGSSTINDIDSYDDYILYPDSFYGNYGKFIEMLISKNKNIKIYLVAPPFAGTKNRTQGFIEKVRVAVKEIGEYYNLPVIDLYGEIGVNKKTYKYYLCDDEVHFLQEGYDMLGRYFATKLI